jgi:hypothetical protein
LKNWKTFEACCLDEAGGGLCDSIRSCVLDLDDSL